MFYEILFAEKTTIRLLYTLVQRIGICVVEFNIPIKMFYRLSFQHITNYFKKVQWSQRLLFFKFFATRG